MPAPVRVLAIGNAYPPHHLGGYEIIWQGVMAWLRQEGHSVRILTTGHRSHVVPGAGEGEDPDVHRQLDWYWRDHEWRRLGPTARLRVERHNAEVLDHHLEQFTPHVIAWWPVGGMSLGMIERARRRGVPAVFFVLDYWPVYGPRHDLWQRMWRFGAARLAVALTGLPARVDYREAGHWVFCSHIVRERTLAALGPLERTRVIGPGVRSTFAEQERASPAPPWRWRLLYVGRVVEQKGVLTAVESLAQLPPEAELLIVGDGDAAYRAELERAAARLGVAGRIGFAGHRPHGDLIDVYRDADAVLFPALWEEPWGLVPLEAMALGRPVLATGRGGSGDYLRDRENAILFPAGDASALASALRSLAADAELRARLRHGGYLTVDTHGERAFNREAGQEIVAAARPS